MISTILALLGPKVLTGIAALVALASAFIFGHVKGAAAEKKNTDLVKARAETAQAANAAADARADAQASQAVAEAGQQRQKVDADVAAQQPSDVRAELNANWSRD